MNWLINHLLVASKWCVVSFHTCRILDCFMDNQYPRYYARSKCTFSTKYSSSITNILDISTKPTKSCSSSSLLSNDQNLIPLGVRLQSGWKYVISVYNLQTINVWQSWLNTDRFEIEILKLLGRVCQIPNQTGVIRSFSFSCYPGSLISVTLKVLIFEKYQLLTWCQGMGE